MAQPSRAYSDTAPERGGAPRRPGGDPGPGGGGPPALRLMGRLSGAVLEMRQVVGVEEISCAAWRLWTFFAFAKVGALR
jgi:hypothetical protein